MEIKEYQTVLLNMVSDFARMCDANSLTYYLIGGSALGAVRHHGFIPWDDDVDICLPRKDYDKLQELVKRDMADHYSLFYRENACIYQLLDLSEKVVFKNDNYTLGNGNGFFACLDIFPLDGAPNNALFRHIRMARITLTRFFLKLGYIQSCYEGTGRKKWENLLINFSKRLHTEKWVKPSPIARHWDKLARKNDYETSNWCMLAHSIYRMRDIFPKIWTEPGCIVDFETEYSAMPMHT